MYTIPERLQFTVRNIREAAQQYSNTDSVKDLDGLLFAFSELQKIVNEYELILWKEKQRRTKT